METLIFGTRNEAKIKQIGGILEEVGIKVFGLPNNRDVPTIEEDGKNAAENARKKALAYSKALNKPVFSMDNVLHLDGLKEQIDLLHIRQLKGDSKDATDEEVIEQLSKIIERSGGKINGYWEYGICLARPDGSYNETVIKEPRIFVAKASNIIQKGYPMSSLQIDPESGKYMSEMTKEELDELWQKSIGGQVLNFLQSTLH